MVAGYVHSQAKTNLSLTFSSIPAGDIAGSPKEAVTAAESAKSIGVSELLRGVDDFSDKNYRM